jgi:hypothetical protein
MPTIYQKETLESILGLLLDGQGNAVPHHCQTKSESAISRFLNHYNWSTRSYTHHSFFYLKSCFIRKKKRTKTHFTSYHRFNYLRKSWQVSSLQRFGTSL